MVSKIEKGNLFKLYEGGESIQSLALRFKLSTA